jgi:tetrahydromethanopterin S-methyltransferase subunit G
MVEDWELKSVERRIDSLERSIERDRERVEELEQRRSKRRSERIESILWTLYGIVLAFLFLAAAGFFDRP